MSQPHPWCPKCMACHVEHAGDEYVCHPEAQMYCFYVEDLQPCELLDSRDHVGDSGPAEGKPE